MTTQFSPSNWAAQKSNDFFRIADQDGLAKTGAKATGRAVTNAVLTVAAAIETVVLAVLTAITSPLMISSRTSGVTKSLANRTSLAASAVAIAAKGIVGIEKQEAKAPKATSFREQIVAAIKSAAAKVGKNPGKTAAVFLSGAAMVAGAIMLRNHFATSSVVSQSASVDEILNNVWVATGRVFSQSHKDALANVASGSFNGIASMEAAKILA